MTKIPSEKILESLYTLRIRESDQLTYMEVCQKILVMAKGKDDDLVAIETKRRSSQKSTMGTEFFFLVELARFLVDSLFL